MSLPLRTDRAEMDRWAEELAKSPVREQPPTTVSGRPIEPLYTPNDLNGRGGESDDRYPGQYPFTRGIHASMYRGRLWTMRQFAGFGTSEETNARFRYLLEHGQTGLSTAIDTLEDMRRLFAGIDLGKVSVSMTINAPAAIMLAFYVAAAESDPEHPT